MIKYEATIQKSSGRKFTARVTANGKKFVLGQTFRSEEDARRDSNYLLTKVEQLNGDWDAPSGKKLGTYHYMKGL